MGTVTGRGWMVGVAVGVAVGSLLGSCGSSGSRDEGCRGWVVDICHGGSMVVDHKYGVACQIGGRVC